MTNDHPPSPESPATGDPVAAPEPAIEPAADTAPPVATRKRWIAAAAAALGVALFAVPLLRGPDDHSSVSGPSCAAKSQANLNFTLKDANGADVKLADYKGKVVLLNFWATWCGPCKLEIPEFVEAYARYRDKGFVILGVLNQDDPTAQDLKGFMTEYKMNYPVFREHQPLADANGELWALPTSFVIDRHGSICSKHMGAMSKDLLDQEIKGLL